MSPYNLVLNFAWHTQAAPRPDLKAITVPATLPAVVAVELAGLNGAEVLVIRDASGAQLGLFFPGFLWEHLPRNDRVSYLGLSGSLLEQLRAIDLVEPDFHSELVNIQPDLRVFPKGPHVTASNPCATHQVPTTKY